jgi:hypothetical protein
VVRAVGRHVHVLDELVPELALQLREIHPHLKRVHLETGAFDACCWGVNAAGERKTREITKEQKGKDVFVGINMRYSQE